jgi:hypothetical protein
MRRVFGNDPELKNHFEFFYNLDSPNDQEKADHANDVKILSQKIKNIHYKSTPEKVLESTKKYYQRRRQTNAAIIE